ncbi:VPA1269 family protein [Sulfitobacter sp. 1A13191]
MNASVEEFHNGKVPLRIIEEAKTQLALFESHIDVSHIPRFKVIVDEGDALFPAKIPLSLGRNAGSKVFASLVRNYTFFEKDWVDLKEYFKEIDIEVSFLNPVRRVLFILQLCTSVRKLSDMSEEFWAAFISTLKEDNSQWKSGIGINNTDRRAFKIVADYMNSRFPSSTGFDKPVKVHRSANSNTTLGKTSNVLTNPPADLADWVKIWKEYQSINVHKSGKLPNAAARVLLGWLQEYPIEVRSNPKVFLSKIRSTPSLLHWVKSQNKGKLNANRAASISFLTRMADWYIEEEMSVAEDGELSLLGVPLLTPSQTRSFETEKASIWAGRNTEAAAANLPLKWIKKLQEVLTYNDWEWPKSLESHYFYTNINGEPVRVWNPVCSHLFYAMTEMPWRKIQFKQLDSGEGDKERYDYLADKWRENGSPHAGYWENQPDAKRKMRGVLNKRGSDFHFYVNTNKTADRKQGFGEMSGYEVPWKHVPLIKLLSELREWQEKYNPVSGPARYKEVVKSFHSTHDAPADEVMENTPDRFYLFRDPQGLEGKAGPPTDHRLLSFWRLLLDELEKRLQDEGEDALLIASRNASGGPLSVYFGPHGLRVAGLTAFAEAGVPIEILSKLVAGHASILMTIYYLRYTPAHVTDLLSVAREKVEAIAAGEFARYLKDSSLKNASRIAVSNEDYTLERVVSGEISTDLFFDTGLGVCPFAGSRCHDGVMLGKGRTGAVPGGPKNCLHCRHFITGEPWLNPLVLNQQRLSAKIQSLSQKYNEQVSALEKLEIKRASIRRTKGRSAIPPSLKRNIVQLEEEIERHAMALDVQLSTMHIGHNLIERIKNLQLLPNEDGAPVLVADASLEIEGYREGTRFELIDSVLQASRIYPVLRDDHLELERQRFIDAVMYHNGMKPLSMMALSDDQKRRAADAASEWLLRKVGAQETDLLIQGAQTLEELGYDPREFGAGIGDASSGTLSIEAVQ